MKESVYPLEILYDGACAICRHDVARLRRADRHGRLRFSDIAASGFDAASYGATPEALGARIHARCADGRMVVGLEVFRLALEATGRGWLIAPTRWPGLRPLAERGYLLFARHRLFLSRRFGSLFARITPVCDGVRCEPRS